MKIYDGIKKKWTGSLDLSLKVLNPKIFGSFTLVIHRIKCSRLHL